MAIYGAVSGNAEKTHCPKGHPYDEENTYWFRHNVTGNPARKCLACKRERDRDYQQNRARKDEAWKARRARIKAAWVERNHEKNRAHNIVETALRHGTLPRPDACQQCGKAGTPEASHDDYNKPLEVEWLCRRCHARKDRKLDRAALRARAAAVLHDLPTESE